MHIRIMHIHSIRSLFLAFTAALMATSSLPGHAQDQRPAVVPMAQTTGNSSASNALSSIGGLTDEPMSPGQVVHISVFNAPDFSVVTRVSESGEVAVPMLGALHLQGLNSQQASDLITRELKERNLILDPHVMVTVESSSTGITVLGEVRTPGIYPPPGKHMLSDLLATAGGMTANTGRVIEISNDHNPSQKDLVLWDPTMHNTANYDRLVQPGDRVIVHACGLAYIGGHVAKPGAYSLCGSPQITLSQAIALAGGTVPLTSERHSYLIRTQPDGIRVAEEIDISKILRGKAVDPVVHEDDIVFVTPSAIKDALTRASAFAIALTGPI
ncbi:MAG: SLBB domain-containing protein, partial [Terracidiphilus sp.]